jgi:hypothetical protein
MYLLVIQSILEFAVYRDTESFNGFSFFLDALKNDDVTCGSSAHALPEARKKENPLNDSVSR